MKLLITGGCGFLGHHLVEHFLKASPENEIVILDRLSYASSGYDRLRDIQAFDDKRVRVLGADLGRKVSDGTQQEIGQIDFIVHAAAETHVDNSIVNPLPFLEANVLGTHWLLMLARELQPKRTFVISTDEVYGPAPEGFAGFDVGDRYRPTNPYAAAKTGSEAICFAYSNTFRIPVTIVNGMNFIGERQHSEKFLVKTILCALSGETLPIHASPDLKKSGTRFYLHCRNFAAALGFMMNQDNVPPKVHVVGEKELSNLDLAQMIAGYVGKSLNYEMVNFHASRPGHDLRYAMVDHYLSGLGWKHPLPIEESLKRTIQWYLKPENKRWLEWT